MPAQNLATNTFDPAILPLLSTSIGLFYAMIQPTIFKPFIHTSRTSPREAIHITHLWWTNFSMLGLSTILTIGAANLVAGIYTLRRLQSGTLEWKVAAAGLAFALGHFAWAPKIGGVIMNMLDQDVAKKGDTIKYLRQWLRIHTWRTCLVDVPAVGCFAWLVFGRA